MDDFLSLQNITKVYSKDTPPALDNLSLSLTEGSITAIIGENGAGKSTLLKAVAGLEDISGGNIFYKGTRLNGPADQLVAGHPEIKMLLQDHYLRPNRSVGDNIRYELRAYPLDYINERMDHLLHLCKAENLRNKKPQELSGGEKQKAALAVALADKPNIILLDEPFSNYDVLSQRQLKKELIQIFAAEKTTLLFSTHHPADALSLADNIIAMRNGKIVQAGPPEIIYASPADFYVLQLTGEFNLVPSKWIAHAGPQKQYYLRPEHLHVTNSDSRLKGFVIECLFFGSYYQIAVNIDQHFIMFYSATKLSVGEKVNLDLDPVNIIVLGKHSNLE